MFFVSPPQLQMKPDILSYLDEHSVHYELESDIDRVIGEVDVIYQTRIRPERLREIGGQEKDGLRRYAINSTVVQRMKQDAIILHPLPRTVEFNKSVDADPRALYFRQAEEWTLCANGAVDHASGQGTVNWERMVVGWQSGYWVGSSALSSRNEKGISKRSSS